MYYCEICQESFLSPHAGREDDRYIFICNDCIADEQGFAFFECEECGNFAFTHQSGDDPSDAVYVGDLIFCSECYQMLTAEIEGYFYSPCPEFQGNGVKYFGIELEVDDGGEDEFNAGEIRNILGDVVYFKHDGSLEDGFEIVSHPCTIDVHMYEVRWEEALKKLDQMGYTSHDCGTCGLHVHVSRDAFGTSQNEQEVNIGKTIFLFEKFWDNFVEFSRRKRSQVEEWADRYFYDGEFYTHSPQDLYDRCSYGDRYHAINLQNDATVEFRIFRGTLRYLSFIACLQLVDVVTSRACAYEWDDIDDVTWSDLVGHSGYDELEYYLRERGLLPSDAQSI